MRILFLFPLLISFSLAAQLPSKKFDSLSRKVSSIQLATAGKLFANDKGSYKLSFSDENFVVFFASKLATKAAYRFSKGVDLLYLTENIDLSKCIKVSGAKINTGDIEAVTLTFPKGSLKTKVLDADGNVKSTILEDKLYFYYDNSPDARSGVRYEEQNPYVLMSALIELCYMSKVEKKLMTEKQLDALVASWISCMEAKDDLMLECEQFLLKYPSSLYSPFVRSFLNDVRKRFAGG